MERKKHLSMHLSTQDKDQYIAKLFEIIRKIYVQTLNSLKKRIKKPLFENRTFYKDIFYEMTVNPFKLNTRCTYFKKLDPSIFKRS